MPFRLAFTLVALLCSARALYAQQATPPADVPVVDVGDLWRTIRKQPPAVAEPVAAGDAPPRVFVIAPVIGVKPDTGFLFGVAGNIASHRGDPATTHISSSVFSFSLSTKGQKLAAMRFTAFTNEDRWLVMGDNRFQWTSQDTFGLGTSTDEAAAVDAKYNFFRIYENAYRRIDDSLFLGGGLRFNTHTNIGPKEEADAGWDTSPSVLYSQAHGLPVDSATSGGLSIGMRFDSRDNQINPNRGWYANASYSSFFEGFLGGDSNWQQVDFDLRAYRNLTSNKRHRLAGWLFGDFAVAGVAPYYDLPATAMDTFGRSGRGYPEGRFRGDQLMYAEVEYRTTLTANGLFGMVAFLNATTVSAPDGGESLFDVVAPGGGLGARVLLSKRSRTNLCVDVGWGREGSRGVYLSVQEAF